MFRQALEHVENEGSRIISILQQIQQSGCKNFEHSCQELLRKIGAIRETIEISFTKITKHDIEQLSKFQVI